MEGLANMDIELPSLYPHQQDQATRAGESLRKNRSSILCTPPGGGKTRMAKWMLGKALSLPHGAKRSGRVLFTVHRRGLVDNASNSFNESPVLPHGVIMSGRDTLGGMPLQVASVDTLLSWYCDGDRYKYDLTYDFIVLDEAHSHFQKLQKYLLAHNKKREQLGLHPPFVLGLSATPQAKGLSDIFNDIVPGPTTQWLIDNKFLSPFRYFQATSGDMSKLVKLGDDFTKDSVASAMEGLSGDMIRDWKKYAEGRATVGFFPRRSHAKDAMELLRASGVRCEYVDGETPDENRIRMFKDLNNGDIDYICNVGVIERGTDIPRIGCVQMCTAVGSIVRYFQMLGRGSRVHEAVEDCIVLDHGSNVKRHGFFEDEVEWTLDWSHRVTKEHTPKATVACPRCNAVYRGGKCSSCGYEPTRRDLTAQGLKFDGTEMVEITERKKKEPGAKQTNEQLLLSCLYKAGKSGKTFKQALGMAYTAAEKQGTKFMVPKHFEVAGKRFEAIPYGSLSAKDKVSATYPFTVGNYSQEANPYFVSTVDTGKLAPTM
jgi:DNA repair protein RadD